MMTPSEVFRWPVEFVKRHWASILAIIAVIFFVSVFKNADFSKSDFGSIGGISMDQISAEQWIMLVVALIVGIFLLYLLRRFLGWIVAIAVIAGASPWIYREWDSTKELRRDATSFLEKEVIVETTLTDFQEKTLPAPVPKAGYYRVSIYASPEYSYVCPGAGGVTPGYTTGEDGFGNIQVQGSKSGSPVGNGETILIDEEKVTLGFRFPTIQWNAIQDCKAIIIGGLKIKLYLKGI